MKHKHKHKQSQTRSTQLIVIASPYPFCLLGQPYFSTHTYLSSFFLAMFHKLPILFIYLQPTASFPYSFRVSDPICCVRIVQHR